jgi:hypothetical protein
MRPVSRSRGSRDRWGAGRDVQMDAFGEMVDDARRQRRWGYNRLSVEIGIVEIDGEPKILNPTQIRRLLTGERRDLQREWVERIIEVLFTTEKEKAAAWRAADRWPADLSETDYQRFRNAAREAVGMMRRSSWAFSWAFSRSPRTLLQAA